MYQRQHHREQAYISPDNLDLFNLSTVLVSLGIIKLLREKIQNPFRDLSYVLGDESSYVFGRWWGGARWDAMIFVLLTFEPCPHIALVGTSSTYVYIRVALIAAQRKTLRFMDGSSLYMPKK